MKEPNRIEWAALLQSAIEQPGRISEAYRRFHGYSLGNRLWAMAQCVARDIQPGPLASFHRWKELGRHVKSGAKALSLCMPITTKRKQINDAGSETETSCQFFALKNNWFVLSQTEGSDYTPEPLPEWNEAEALKVMDIVKHPFDVLNGNVQGYAAPGRTISVSPIAVNPFKTLFHELAHVLLGHIERDVLTDTEHTPHNVMEVEAESVAMLCCASLELPGIEYSRGYIQSWAKGEPISERSAQRIFAAADGILRAGTKAPVSAPRPEETLAPGNRTDQGVFGGKQRIGVDIHGI
jgi:antirestriction protein ArdC